MSDDVAAEWVGSASTPGGIASELAVACEALRTVDYNALSPEELGEALDAFETLQELCLTYRQRQSRDRQPTTDE
jgi:hypothetical protein